MVTGTSGSRTTCAPSPTISRTLKPEAWAAYVAGLVAGYGVGPNGEARNPVIESTAADYKGRVTRFLWMAFRAASTLDATADGFQWVASLQSQDTGVGLCKAALALMGTLQGDIGPFRAWAREAINPGTNKPYMNDGHRGQRRQQGERRPQLGGRALDRGSGGVALGAAATRDGVCARLAGGGKQGVDRDGCKWEPSEPAPALCTCAQAR